MQTALRAILLCEMFHVDLKLLLSSMQTALRAILLCEMFHSCFTVDLKLLLSKSIFVNFYGHMHVVTYMANSLFGIHVRTE